MNSIKESKALINQVEDLSKEQIIDVFFKIGEAGDVIILKNDGIRDTKLFSVIILSSQGLFESIRFDGDNLSEILKATVKSYMKNID